MTKKFLLSVHCASLWFTPQDLCLGVQVRTFDKGNEEATLWFIHLLPMLTLILQSDRRPIGRSA